jgi:succinyl-diaminopimelate desuccinylase
VLRPAAEIDPVALARDLIRCPSVTPIDAGALDVLERSLSAIGFACHRLKFGTADSDEVDNLYARIGGQGPNFCFAGHTDVVPAGDEAAWRIHPFAGEIRDGMLHGRGAVDMKGAIACFVAATTRYMGKRNGALPGAISLLITGDEEGAAVNGTKRVLEWLARRGEALDACLVGEPTNPTQLGETIKIGRRGSLNGRLTVHGVQGHVAYPHLAENPIHRLIEMLARVIAVPLDDGSAHFQPSALQISSIDVGNPASNVIPAEARAVFNIRFNDRHTGRSLEQWLRGEFDAVGARYELAVEVSGEAFLTPPGRLSTLVSDAVETVLRRRPGLSTTGGTSDARFIKDHCPVAEFGLTSLTMHQVDERVALADLATLTDIYEAVLDRFFATLAPSC